MSNDDGFPQEKWWKRRLSGLSVIWGKKRRRPAQISQTASVLISFLGAGCSIATPLWNRWVVFKKAFAIPDTQLLFEHLDFVYRDWPAMLLAVAFIASIGFNVRVRHDNDFVCFLSAFGLPALFVLAMRGSWKLII